MLEYQNDQCAASSIQFDCLNEDEVSLYARQHMERLNLLLCPNRMQQDDPNKIMIYTQRITRKANHYSSLLPLSHNLPA